MKVQYKLVDLETGNSVAIGEEFELVEQMNFLFVSNSHLSWEESCILFGEPMSTKNPIGLLNIVKKEKT